MGRSPLQAISVRSRLCCLQHSEHPLRPPPVFLGIDILHAVMRQDDGQRGGREGVEILQKGVGAAPVELSGIVIGGLQILRAGEPVLGLKDGDATVRGQLEGALYRVWKGGDGKGEVGRFGDEAVQPELEVRDLDEGGGRIDAADKIRAPDGALVGTSSRPGAALRALSRAPAHPPQP